MRGDGEIAGGAPRHATGGAQRARPAGDRGDADPLAPAGRVERVLVTVE